MLSFVLLGSIYIAWLARRRSKVVTYGLSGHVKTKFWAHTFEYASILSAVLLLYHALLLFADWGWQFATVDKLVRLETSLNAFQAFVTGTLKLSWERTLLLLLIIYVLGLFQVRLVESGVVSKNFKSLRKGLKLLNKAAILLCAFTILGQDAGRPATTLQVRLRTTRHEYGALRAEVEDALSARAGQAINRRVLNTFPVAYQQLPVLVLRRDDADSRLRQSYQDFQINHGVHDRSAESAMRGANARQTATARVEKAASDAHPAPADGEDAPPDASYQKIEGARDAVRNYRSGLGDLASSPAGRDILTHFHKLITSKLPPSIARLIADAYPELVPALEVLSETIDDAITFKINDAVYKITKDAAGGHADVARDIDASADRIGETLRVNVTPSQADDAVKKARGLQAEIDSATKATAELKTTAQRLDRNNAVRATVARTPPRTTEAPGETARPDAESSDLAILRRGLESGWVVTRNTGSGKIFVHAQSSGGMLSDLRYLVEESSDGETWTIHTPSRGSDGASRYGRPVGTITKPPDVDVGRCNCP